MSSPPSWNLRDATAADAPALAALLGSATDLALAAGERRLLAAQADGTLLATLRLCPPLGLQTPRHWYRVGCAVHASAELGLFLRQATLLLGNDLTGAHELADIALAPGAGAALHGLVLAALQAVDGRVIAELPGLRDGDGRSPFWDGLGRHFCALDPRQAEARLGPAWRSDVATLLPRQLLYSAFLPDAAQAAVGAVHPHAQAVQQALLAAGLRWQHQVRIDDGGPVLEHS
jgi:arginine N-succinyltransferase